MSKLFSFALPRSSSLRLLFLASLFFSFAGYFLGFISEERFFGRLLGLFVGFDGMSCGWNFRVN